MEVVGNVPISPVIVVVLTAPATVMPEPASTAKPSAVPRSTEDRLACTTVGRNTIVTAGTSPLSIRLVPPPRSVRSCIVVFMAYLIVVIRFYFIFEHIYTSSGRVVYMGR